jgi:hypothetical protein
LEDGQHTNTTVHSLSTLFETLAERAIGLRSIRLEWTDYEWSSYIIYSPNDIEANWNWSFHLALLRSFATIRGVKDLFLSGDFPEEWPGYLEQKTGIKVNTIFTVYHLMPEDNELCNRQWKFPYPRSRPTNKDLDELKK